MTRAKKTRNVVTGFQVASLLMQLRSSNRPVWRARDLAELLGTDSRAIATALRAYVDDGDVDIVWKDGLANYSYNFNTSWNPKLLRGRLAGATR